MKPEPGDVVGCVNCQTDFTLETPATDTFYVPQCPYCGTIVGGYEDAANMKRRASEAETVCDQIEHELFVIRDEMQEMREESVHPASQLSVLERTAERITELEKYVSDAVSDL